MTAICLLNCTKENAVGSVPDLMNPLPSAIEHSLTEAGCSPTEIVLIQHLLGGQPTTLRILAQKTGKSTGVLDQAMKKLMKKSIVVREQVNDNPKFVLKSLQNVLQWLHDETLHQRELLLRKYQTFESFVASMENEQSRPEMKYFEGDEGMERAYFALLEHGKHWRQYVTLQGKEQDDPLWQMRVRLFRVRKERGIFCRVLTHERELGKAFQNRDPYEFRETLLLPADECAIPCEKIIADDVVACFQPEIKRACFVRFPEQAQYEKTAFDLLWQIAHEKTLSTKTGESLKDKEKFYIKNQTQLLSNFRSFFLKPANVASFTMALLSGLLLSGLVYVNYSSLTLQRMREKMLSSVSVGAKLFDVADIENIRTTQDMDRPEYNKIVQILREFRKDSSANVVYAYLLRPTLEVGEYEFIAEADGDHPTKPVDFNNDGQLSEADEYALPGRKYVSVEGDELNKSVPSTAVVNKIPLEDQWGSFYTAYAPILNSDNKVIALLAIDVWTSEFTRAVNATFIGGFWFIIFFSLIFITFAFLVNFKFKLLPTHTY